MALSKTLLFKIIIISLLILGSWGFNLMSIIAVKKAGIAVIERRSWQENLLWQTIANGAGFLAFEAIIFLTGLTSLNLAYLTCYAPGLLFAQFTAGRIYHEKISFNQNLAFFIMIFALFLYFWKGRIIE